MSVAKYRMSPRIAGWLTIAAGNAGIDVGCGSRCSPW